MKTVKRKANIGERILITKPYGTAGHYRNGDIGTVIKGCRFSGDLVFVKEWDREVNGDEYEVIIEETNEMSNGIIEKMQEEINELKSKVAALEGSKISIREAGERTFRAIIENVEKSTFKSPQQVRDEIVAKAKADISELKSKWGNYQVPDQKSCVPWACVADFIVNAEKRTVVVLLKGEGSGKLRFKGISKAKQSDCFNSHIGKAIALRRALSLDVPAEYYNAPNPTEVRVGDVLWSSNDERKYTVGVGNSSYLPLTYVREVFGSPENDLKIIDDSK